MTFRATLTSTVGPAIAAVILSCAAEATEPESHSERAQPSALPNVLPAEAVAFQNGFAEFIEEESPLEGLGPFFNATSCAKCHAIPVVGGAGVIDVVRAGYEDENGTFFSATPQTSLIFLFSTRPDIVQAAIPSTANRVGRRRSLTTQGIGLIEAIDDATIEALAQRKGLANGVAGRARWIVDMATGQPRIGRLGWKAQHATLRAFSADAYRTELGITNELFAQELEPNGDPSWLERTDPLPEPEARQGVIDRLAEFMRFSAPPAAQALSAPAELGRQLFTEIGCADCHVPMLITGTNASPALDRVAAHLYSDLLLHDIGTGDGIADGEISGDEFRTPPLWGLRHRAPYLHDGSAPTVEAATLAHDLEASASRQAYLGRSAAEIAAVSAFLRSL